MDKRDDKPSASALPRLYRCPGSHKMSIGLEDKITQEADRGTTIHRELARLFGFPKQQPDSSFPADMRDAVEKMRSKMQVCIDDFAANYPQFDVICEKRFWWVDSELNRIWSGQPDIVLVAHDRSALLVADYKSGWGTDESPTNEQLRGLVVLLDRYFRKPKVMFAAIVDPGPGSALVTMYSRPDIDKATAEVIGKIKAADEDNASLVPGSEQCKYCRGKVRCQAYAGWVGSAMPIPAPKNMDVAKLDDDQLLQVWMASGEVEHFIESVDDEIKKRKQETETRFPELKWKNNGFSASVNDVSLAYNQLKNELNSYQFLECCVAKPAQLRERLAKALSITAKDADAKLSERLGQNLVIKEKAKSLIEV